MINVKPSMSIEEVDDIFICMMEESGHLNSNVPYSSMECSLCGARCVDSILALSSSPWHSFPLHEAWTQLVSINIRTPYTAARTCLLSLALYLSFPRWQRLLTCTACNLHVHKDLPKLSFSFTLQGTRRGRHHRIVPERVLCEHMLCHCAMLELKILFVLKLA